MDGSIHGGGWISVVWQPAGIRCKKRGAAHIGGSLDPRLRDVENMLAILRELGADYRWETDGTLWLDMAATCAYTMPQRISKEIRSSIFMLGPLLARFGRAVCTYPGGCEIGNRPIDLHLSGLAARSATGPSTCT